MKLEQFIPYINNHCRQLVSSFNLTLTLCGREMEAVMSQEKPRAKPHLNYYFVAEGNVKFHVYEKKLKDNSEMKQATRTRRSPSLFFLLLTTGGGNAVELCVEDQLC